tara:strand:- start:25 stop:570 length:546 start_codon:yes stop_codon:yes gene_type:complete
MGVSKYIKIKIASSIFNNYRVDTEVNSYRLSIKKILAFPFNLLVLCIPPILSSFANCIRMLYKYLFVRKLEDTVRLKDIYVPNLTREPCGYKINFTVDYFKGCIQGVDCGCSNNFKQYKWEKLVNSIKKYGVLKPILVNKISTRTGHTFNFKYYLSDGNHRYIACKSIYGLNYKIPVIYEK